MSSKAADARESDQRRLVTSESSSAFQARATAGGAAATTPSEALAPQLQPRKKSSPLKKALWFLRGIAAFFGAIIFWVGLWNIFANGFIAEETWWWNVINIIIGVVVLVGTNTMGTLAGHDPNEDNFRLDDRRALWPQKMAASVRGFFALSASVILWKGFWNLCDMWIGTSTWTRELLFMIAGLLTLIFTDTFWNQAGINRDRFRADNARETPEAIRFTISQRNPMSFFQTNGEWD